MKTLFKVIGVILLLCIALIVAAPFLIPTDTIFNKVSEQVEKTTGRTLTIKGDKTLSVFPVTTEYDNDKNNSLSHHFSHATLLRRSGGGELLLAADQQELPPTDVLG